MKKLIIITLCLLLICTPLGAVSTYVDESIKVMVNGSPVGTDIVMHENSVFVPLRFMSNQLNAQVAWDSKTRTVAIKKGLTKPTQGQIRIIGSDEFKETINASLSLLKSKAPDKYTMVTNSITSISEANLGKTISNILASSGVCKFNLSGYKTRTNTFTAKEKQIHIASILVHEGYHANLNKRGIQDVANGISVLESEILAHAKQRQTLKALGASQRLLDITSVDYVIDTDYKYAN